jgi:hypothetical protein
MSVTLEVVYNGCDPEELRVYDPNSEIQAKRVVELKRTVDFEMKVPNNIPFTDIIGEPRHFDYVNVHCESLISSWNGSLYQKTTSNL